MADATKDQERPGTPLTGTEAETLLAFLERARATFAWKTDGLDDAQLRAAMQHPTTMTLAGLLAHLARVEEHWFSEVVGGQPPVEPWASTRWGREWKTAHERTGEDLRAAWRTSVERSREVVRQALAEGGLEGTHRKGRRAHSLRFVLVHMVDEYARHLGHADLLREDVDGQVGH